MGAGDVAQMAEELIGVEPKVAAMVEESALSAAAKAAYLYAYRDRIKALAQK